jgi:hypothetical protein
MIAQRDLRRLPAGGYLLLVLDIDRATGAQGG